MKKKEKTEFVLEQMRLCLLKNDFVRTQIVSRKINPKIFEDLAFQGSLLNYNFFLIFQNRFKTSIQQVNDPISLTRQKIFRSC